MSNMDLDEGLVEALLDIIAYDAQLSPRQTYHFIFESETPLGSPTELWHVRYKLRRMERYRTNEARQMLKRTMLT